VVFFDFDVPDRFDTNGFNFEQVLKAALIDATTIPALNCASFVVKRSTW